MSHDDVGPPGGRDGEGRSSARPATVEQSEHCITSTDQRSSRQCSSTTQSWRRRRAASLRLPPLGPCGCIRDPDHDHHRCGSEITETAVDAYRDTVLHLRHCGLLAAPRLPEMQQLWRRSSEERRLAAEIAARWELAG